MRVRHHVVIRSSCPVNGDPDVYDCWVYARRVVLCEEVLAAVEAETKGPIYQEALTQALADRLGCQVKSVGTHCRGRVTTAVVCRPRGEAQA
jgi:hypothetical protein